MKSHTEKSYNRLAAFARTVGGGQLERGKFGSKGTHSCLPQSLLQQRPLLTGGGHIGTLTHLTACVRSSLSSYNDQPGRVSPVLAVLYTLLVQTQMHLIYDDNFFCLKHALNDLRQVCVASTASCAAQESMRSFQDIPSLHQFHKLPKAIYDVVPHVLRCILWPSPIVTDTPARRILNFQTESG